MFGNNLRVTLLFLVITVVFLVECSNAGPISWILAACGGYAGCQTACNAGWVACYAAAGLTAGLYICNTNHDTCVFFLSFCDM